jgi:hypothetical protein
MQMQINEARLIDVVTAKAGEFVRPTAYSWASSYFSLGVVIALSDSERAVLALGGENSFRWYVLSTREPEYFAHYPAGDLELEIPDEPERNPGYQTPGALLLRLGAPLACAAPADGRGGPRAQYVNLETWAIDRRTSDEPYQAYQNWCLLSRRGDSSTLLVEASPPSPR